MISLKKNWIRDILIKFSWMKIIFLMGMNRKERERERGFSLTRPQLVVGGGSEGLGPRLVVPGGPCNGTAWPGGQWWPLLSRTPLGVHGCTRVEAFLATPQPPTAISGRELASQLLVSDSLA